ncbi:MAG TPA: sugar ABC transporter ATP-binding protein [Pseudolysinimonas sp.]|nr:sugar ABC transporter ATP-binding protein [Pseudolysinimonas sp.]
MSDADMPAASIANLSKTFAGVKALDNVSFKLSRGAITALLGMNGSGKSTLIKILAGVYQPDPGAEVVIAGHQVALPFSSASAHRAGLRFLHQDVGLVPSLTVADNFAFVSRFRGHGMLAPIDRRAQKEHVERSLARFNIDIDPESLVSTLTPTQRTMVGVARALQDDEGDIENTDVEKILILDEPTAALPAEEVDIVLSALEDLRARGGTVIYVSHRTDEVARIADRLVILRDGKLVADEARGDLSSDEIVEKIVGRKLQRVMSEGVARTAGDTVLTATGLTGPRLRGVDLDVAAGEIVGIAGLVGCGRSELMRILGGAQAPSGGTMSLRGEAYAPRNPAQALHRGVASSPQERRKEGVVMQMCVGENLTLGRLKRLSRGGAISRKLEGSTVASLIDAFAIKTTGARQTIALLSGGNQQKVMLGRAAGYDSNVLLLDEPTQGVDANAKAEIAQLVREQALRGAAVVMASTDFEDFVGLAHRVVLLDRGRIIATAVGDEITVDNLSLLCAQPEIREKSA